MKQISVFLENKPGSLHAVLTKLKEWNINLRALSLADTADFGVLRFIVEKPEQLVEQLRKENFTATLTDILVVGVDDRPGGLSQIVEVLTLNSISIEYLYAFVSPEGQKAYVVMRVEDVQRASNILREAQASLLDEITI
ncbi:MAG TPA: acetolactate synthase [Candidatus Atribacteria bacterium]|nr:acetolactate synthase [Candidatus Atribacteria bacterium]HCU21662.1 acetolactate synthase [Candidatus Atribacteria bacterium]